MNFYGDTHVSIVKTCISLQRSLFLSELIIINPDICLLSNQLITFQIYIYTLVEQTDVYCTFNKTLPQRSLIEIQMYFQMSQILSWHFRHYVSQRWRKACCGLQNRVSDFFIHGEKKHRNAYDYTQKLRISLVYSHTLSHKRFTQTSDH